MRKTLYSVEAQILADFMAETRRAAGVQQGQLAELIGRDQSIISNIERGQRRIDVLEFREFARSLDCDPAALFQSLMQRLDAVN